MNFDAYDALYAGDERAMEGLELPEGAQVVTFCNRGTLRCGCRRAAAAARVRGVLLGGRAGSLEGPPTCPCIVRAGPYRSPGQAEAVERPRWVLLVYRLPREPSRHRVAVWRKLRDLGALYLRTGLRRSPRTPSPGSSWSGCSSG